MVRKLITEATRESVLDGGAPTQADKKQKKPKNGWAFMTLRLPEKAVREIDFIIKDELLLSRTSWIIKAIQQRLSDEYGINI